VNGWKKAIRESVSITADEAHAKNVVDLVVKDMDDLLKGLDGREVNMPAGKITLKTANLKKVHFKPGFRDKVLKTISDPNIAYILMMIGLAGLYFELSHPGAIFPGVIGAISLILAFFFLSDPSGKLCRSHPYCLGHYIFYCRSKGGKLRYPFNRGIDFPYIGVYYAV